MRHLNSVYTQRFNKNSHCDGQIFRGRFKSIIVDADSYLLELLRYIHRNPLESGMVDDINKYVWSSHKAYLSKAKKWDWLHKEYVLSLFSNKSRENVSRYRQFVSKETPEKINRILAGKELPVIIGRQGFVDKMKESFFANKTHEDVPESRYLAPDTENIIEEV